MKVSIVIPNYNGKDLLKNNLPKVIKTAKETEIIVVDDASSDGSVEIVKKLFTQIKIIRHSSNKGFASSVNDGVKEASGDLILLLNSDVAPEDNFINFLLPHFENEKVFAVGSLQKDKKSPKTHGRGIGYFKNGFLIHGPGDPNKKDTLWVFGGAGMFKKSIWERLGGMDEIYNPFYWEDIDLSYRALKCGYKLEFEKKSIVYHHQSHGAVRTYYKTFAINSIAYRNQIIFVWLNITDFQYLLEHILFLPRHILKALFTFNLAFIKGLILAFTMFPNILKKRKNLAKIFTKTDHVILSGFVEEMQRLSMLK